MAMRCKGDVFRYARLYWNRCLRSDRTGDHRALRHPLSEIEAALAEHGQMLGVRTAAFRCRGDDRRRGGVRVVRPAPRYCRRRPRCVLGAELMNGKGETLRFSGQVMKNVAGFDVSRLWLGSMGVSD